MLKEVTGKALNDFGKNVIKQSRSNLTRANKKYKNNLYNSLAFNLYVGKSSFTLAFSMEDYGQFVDQGVRGADPSKVSKNAKIKGQQAPNSEFRFGSGNYRGTWGNFVNGLEDWVKSKNLRLRDEKGKYTKGNTKTIAQIIARNIYARGIKPTMFFTNAFNSAFKSLPDEVVEAYNLDIQEFLKYTIKK